MNEQVNIYRQVDTVGKSQIDLILQVYTGALQAFAAGREQYGQQDFDRGYEEMEKARKFIVHLYTTLDFENGGEVAENLGKLYVFLMNQMDVIEATKDLDKIDSCTKILHNLRQGWLDLKQQSATPRQAAPVAQTSGSFVTSA